MNETNINRLEIEAANVELTDDILQDLMKPVSKRKGFKYNNHVVTIPRYFYRIIGVKRDKEGYCENLCRNHRELSKLGDLYSKFDKGLNKDISIEFQNLLNGIWGKCKVAGRIDTSSLISLINEYSILKLKVSDVLLMQVKNNFKGILDYYLRVNDDKNTEDIRLIVYYCIHWLNKYLTTLFSNFNYKEINPKIIYYGDINKAEAFFLVLLASLGCDILYYNPEKRGELENIDKYNAFSKEVVYVNRMPIVEFPEVVRERVKTTAYNAKEDLNKTLYNEDSNFYRPWQFVDYKIKAVTLKTTYEEINIWAKEKSMIRDGWKIENGTLHIPNIFAKVSGTHGDIDKYWKEVNGIINQKLTKFYLTLPIIEVVPLEYGKLEQVYPNTINSHFDVNKLLKSPWWRYKELRTGLQIAMADKIKELCLNPVIKVPMGIDMRDLQVDIFSVLINLDMKHLQILQGFDYPQEVPKIIIYNNERNGNISYEDSIMLTFMNAMGIDIIIYNPSGYNDIEENIYDEIYDIHRLEELSFNLDFKKYTDKKGFLKNLFNFGK